MKTAAEALREDVARQRMTTGSGELDSLIDGIRQGQFYLFYGDDQEALNTLIHRALINCVLPADVGGFSSKALYLNNTNYHQGKTILDPSRLGVVAKLAGLDPVTAFENIYSICAFNEAQQAATVKEAVELTEHDGDIRLLVIHNLTRFVETSRKPFEARIILKQAVGAFRRLATKNDVALVVSCTASKASRGPIPKPEGGAFLRHEANVIVFLKAIERGAIHYVKAILVKHPYKRTPQSIVLYVSIGGMDLMGRITPSFRQLYQKQIEELKRSSGFQNTLLNLEHKEAFDLLIRDAWSPEDAALSNAGVPCILDILNLMANVHNKKCIEELRERILELEQRLKNQEAAK